MLYGRSFYNLKMYPYKDQLELIKLYEQDNEQAMLRLASAEASGATVMARMTLHGPYMTHTTYRMSNGEFITLISPGDLSWVPMSIYV